MNRISFSRDNSRFSVPDGAGARLASLSRSDFIRAAASKRGWIDCIIQQHNMMSETRMLTCVKASLAGCERATSERRPLRTRATATDRPPHFTNHISDLARYVLSPREPARTRRERRAGTSRLPSAQTPSCLRSGPEPWSRSIWRMSGIACRASCSTSEPANSSSAGPVSLTRVPHHSATDGHILWSQLSLTALLVPLASASPPTSLIPHARSREPCPRAGRAARA